MRYDEIIAKYSSQLRQVNLDNENKDYLELLDKLKEDKTKVTFVLPCCPDYSYKVNNYGWATYTHKYLGGSSGMMLKAYTTGIIEFLNDMNQLGCDVDIVLLYGDIEAEDEYIIKNLSIDKESFINRVRCSTVAGGDHVRNLIHDLGIDINVNVISSCMSEYIYVEEVISAAKEKLLQIPEEILNDIMDKRKEVLVSMYGLKLPQDNAILKEKAATQILDRIILGTGLDMLANDDMRIAVLSLTTKDLVPYINYHNTNKIFTLSLK